MTKNAHPTAFPVLRYKDGTAALAWLDRAFGFARRAAYEAPDGSIAHAELAHGNAMIMVGSGPADPANAWSTVRQGIYVRVDDVDAHHARARAAGAEIVRPLADTDYGARKYSVRDLEGNLWSFGTYDPWAQGS